MEEEFLWSVGRVREIAVSRRVSSRDFLLVGLPTRGCCSEGEEEEVSVVGVMADGSILPMNVHRFLLGAVVEISVVGFLS